jgi:hypothetical protein
VVPKGASFCKVAGKSQLGYIQSFRIVLHYNDVVRRSITLKAFFSQKMYVSCSPQSHTSFSSTNLTSNAYSNLARTSRISAYASLIPIQLCRPNPNGWKADNSSVFELLFKKRSGMKEFACRKLRDCRFPENWLNAT